ncbi:hypothetical protein BaRGS_00033083 [Batillaria attramentaria]|uniref:C1q domain-containing protein n=1 Tax=Batillaria attramentaria TaxID=370345 RepID=A0ABD0JKU3_9CAEN
MPRLFVSVVVCFAASALGIETDQRAKRIGDDPDPVLAALQQMSSKLDAFEAELAAERQAVRTELDSTALNITELLNNQSQQIQTLESNGNHTVMFLARAADTDNHFSHVTDGTIVQFTDEILNVGGGYRKLDSKFVAPVEGNYWIYIHVGETHTRSLQIRKNGDDYTECDFEHVLPVLACGEVMHLSVGDEVTVNHAMDGSGTIANGPNTFFTGFLTH